MNFTRLAAAVIAIGVSAFPAASETLTVGSTPTGVPFTFLDIPSGEITGFMADVVKAVGEKAGFEADIKSTDWVALLPALQSGRIDIIAAAMSITEERKKVVDFSDEVVPYAEGVVMRADDTTQYTTGLSETAGKTIGVQQGVHYVADLQNRPGIGEIRLYDNLADIMRDVQLGRIDVGIGDRPIMAYQIGLGKFPDLKLSTSYEPAFGAPLGLAIAKNRPDLVARINKALAELKASGELDALVAKWHLD